MKKIVFLALTLVLAGAILVVGLTSYNIVDFSPDVRMPDISQESKAGDYPLMDFTSLQSRNPEIVAWLSLDDTDISYAITQTNNNDYYLQYSCFKEKDKNGAIFLDYRNSSDFSDPNSIVYGHNMIRGKMFTEINLFKDQDYFDAHPSGWLYTPEKTYRLEILAVAVVPSIGNAYTWSFDSSSSWDEYTSQLKSDAKFLRDSDIRWGERLVTLSTCSYEFTEARTILVAKLVAFSEG